MRSLATAITSIAIDKDNAFGFPNVTVPHFDIRTQEIADITGTEMFLFVPFVQQDDRSSWQAYATENQDWIAEDYVCMHISSHQFSTHELSYHY
jgi:hypothetical protein